MARAAMSKKVRFEIFKRDQFKCAYCGSAPPAVILHVDHIVPVASGGSNDPDNLVTSCQGCNQGKGAVDLTNVPQSLAEKAALVAEAEAQLKGYQEILAAKRDRLEDEMWRVAEELDSKAGTDGFRRDWLQSIKRFIEHLGYHSVLDAAEIARAKCIGRHTFPYFCGICWKRIRGDAGP